MGFLDMRQWVAKLEEQGELRRDVAKLGTGLRNRLLIDATRSWKSPRRPEWKNERCPATMRPAAEDEERVTARWTKYGPGDL